MTRPDVFVLGIDAGGTKTTCLLADADGIVHAEARGSGANLQSFGEVEVEKTLRDLIERVLSPRPVALSAICLGMAGVDRPGEVETVRTLFARLGYAAPLLVVNDALIALEAGTPAAPGLVVVAGTGSMVYGRDASGRSARAGGWGYLLDDEGSGYWMGRQALRAVVRAADRRGPATSLTARALEHYGIDDPQQLVQAVYALGARPTAIAELAVAVERSAAEADKVAVDILDAGARDLASAAATVAHRLDLTEGPVILAGSIFRVAPTLATRVTRQLQVDLPAAPVRRLEVEPAIGAVRLALAMADDRPEPPAGADAPR